MDGFCPKTVNSTPSGGILMKFDLSPVPCHFHSANAEQCRSGSLSCVRRGNFLCELCLFDSAFTALCPSCRGDFWSPPQSLPIIPLGQFAIFNANLTLAVSLICASPVSITVALESGLFSGIGEFCSFLLLIAIPAGLLSLMVLPILIAVNSHRRGQRKTLRAAALSLLRGHYESIGRAPIPAHCPRCAGASANEISGLCPSCELALDQSLFVSDHLAEGDLPPPWSPLILRRVGSFLLWLASVHAVLALLPPSTRIWSQQHPFLLIVACCATFFGLLLPSMFGNSK